MHAVVPGQPPGQRLGRAARLRTQRRYLDPRLHGHGGVGMDLAQLGLQPRRLGLDALAPAGGALVGHHPHLAGRSGSRAR